MMKYASLIILFFASFSFQTKALSIEENRKKGTLIVTYRTDAKGERLNRIRFWLKDKTHLKYRMYPRGKSFVDDPKEVSRMVVIEDLPAGHYLLQFLVPNTDRYFQKIPIRDVFLKPGEVVKIDQSIKPLRIEKDMVKAAQTIGSRYQFNDDPQVKSNFMEFKDSQSLKVDPRLSDLQPFAKESANPCSRTDHLVDAALEKGYGRLLISYRPAQIEDREVNIRLTGSKGSKTLHPDPANDVLVSLKKGKMIMIPQIEADTYHVEFYLEGDDQQIIHTIPEVMIEEEKTEWLFEILDVAPETAILENKEKKEHPFQATTLALAVTTNVPAARFFLERLGEKRKWKGKGREYTFDQLCAGNYLLSFGSEDPFFLPAEPKLIQLREEPVSIDVTFATLGKLKIMTNIDTAEAMIKDIDNEGKEKKITVSQGIAVIYLPKGDYRVSFAARDLQHLPPYPIQVDVQPLETKIITAYFEKEQTGQTLSARK